MTGMSLTVSITFFYPLWKQCSENHLQQTAQTKKHRKYKSNNEQTNIPQKTKLQH